ncbi:sigma-70 family RNA polymerase sigma factor [Bacteroides eggerthii]|uniref:Sigma-70 family RNA polymerase sigma factor n=1 Tax=Bacteroides eggerthii TaxID=28111 RepID=A0ABT7U4Y4_9BACE|nr:sigma-70 family RNA polymerase sigma factor [Bacteroides eggerthii]
MTSNEEELVRQLQDKSLQRAAFARVVSIYSEPIYWQIRRIVLSHDDANDLLQNTFIKAWTNLDAFRGDSKISTWLYRIAINGSLNFVQKQKNHFSLDEDSSVVDFLMSDEFFDGDELQAQLQEVIARLPEKQRLVFQMKYFQDMKYEEISEILGTSVGALKATYHHAVKKIAEFFQEED